MCYLSLIFHIILISRKSMARVAKKVKAKAKANANGTFQTVQINIVQQANPPARKSRKAKKRQTVKRLQYDRLNLKKAYDEYNADDNQGLSIRALARAWSVPETTLRDRIRGRVSVDAKVGQYE